MKEKQELLALNNQMALQIQSLKGSPTSDKSTENVITSPVEESATSDVLFVRVSGCCRVRDGDEKKSCEKAVTAGRNNRLLLGRPELGCCCVVFRSVHVLVHTKG